jgi:hypothetical protein
MEHKCFTVLGVLLLGCGYVSQIFIAGIGQLYWAETVLPALALVLVLNRWPTELFGSMRFRVLALSLFLMLIGYMVSDVVAGTTAENYLRGWLRVLVLATDAISLIIIYERNRWALWWFWLGWAVFGLQAAIISGIPLTKWKFGYGEPITTLALNFSVLLPVWLSAALVGALGAVSIVFDYRSLGAIFLAASAILMMSRFTKGAQLMGNVGLRSRILLATGVIVAAAATVALLGYSDSQEYAQRRGASNIGRVAALRIGAIAIADSPLLGYGSWGQGTGKYAEMHYQETVDEYSSIDVASGGAGSVFLAHSQIIQAWMEGGLLAAIFFMAYGWYIGVTAHDLALSRISTRFKGFHLTLLLMSMWHLFMSPFMGPQRLTIASTVAIVVCGAMAARKESKQVHGARAVAVLAPPNLLR